MKLVLLSGGSGKRLWPLSNDSRSKQFLRILEGPSGELESMVQRVWRQLSVNGLQHSAYLATGKSQVEMIQSQLTAEVPIIVEPERRDTFPAIALAATYLYTLIGVGLNEVVVVLPVDPYVEDHFFERFHDLEQALLQSGADMALMGVKPTFPSEKYGYIVPVESGSDHFEGSAGHFAVGHFREKPDKETARELIARHALWNCGVFAFKLDYLISRLIERGLPIQYEEMAKQYGKLNKISFDYEVLEKASKIVAIPYDGTWKDLGTWNTLTEEMKVNQLGNGIISDDSQNTHLINELNIPVTVIGMSNVLVATSPDGILVTEKSKSPRIKDVMNNFEQRPMYEERRWGWYKVIDYFKFDNGIEMLTKRFCVRAGKNLSYQLHQKRNEVWIVIAGDGEYVLNDRLYTVRAGDVLQFPALTRHSVRAFTDLEVIEVQTGTELVEEDIVRIATLWEEIAKYIVYEDLKG